MDLHGARPAAWVPWLAFAGTLALLASLTHDTVFTAGNDAARWALVESLGNRGETWIERSPFAWTIDRVTVAGHDYANKPPLLSLVGAGLYRLGRPLGLGFEEPRAARTIWLLTLLLVGLPTAWAAAELARSVERFAAAPAGVAALCLLTFGAGTVLTSFSTTLNNHTVAAALLLGALRAAWLGRGGRAGLFGGLATCVDVVPGLGLLPVAWAGLAAADLRRARRRFLLALAATAALGIAANLFVAGSPLLPKMLRGAHDWSSRAAPAVAGVLLPDEPLYPLRALFGGHGFFSVSPVLLFAAFGLAAAVRRPRNLTRRQVVWLAAGLALQVLFHVFFAGSFGGWSYGFRYLVPIVPVLLLFLPWALGGWRTPLFAVALAVSIATALLGAYHPWPPGYEQQAERHPVAALVQNPVGGNAAAWLAEYDPESRAARFAAATFISPDPARQREYLAYFFWSKGDTRLLRRFQP